MGAIGGQSGTKDAGLNSALVRLLDVGCGLV
jgi:hypothetical protein